MLLHSWPYYPLQPNEEQYHHPGGRNSDIIPVAQTLKEDDLKV